MDILAVRNLRKVFGRRVVANEDISLGVGRGEIMGVLGPNGAGKSTLLHQCLGLTKPTSGSITIEGHDVVAEPAIARERCSFQPQIQAPPWGLKPRRSIALMGRMRGMDRRGAERRTEQLVERLELGEWADRPMNQLSGGAARLVSFCFAVVCPGDIVILDEPTNDVDPVRRRLLWDVVRDLAAAGSAVLLVTHNAPEAQQAVDRLVIVDHGRVVAAGRPSELSSRVGDQLRLELRPAPGATIEEAPFDVDVGNRIVAMVPPDRAEEAVRWCREQQRLGLVESYSLGPSTLEDIYLASVGEHA
jgi:ABC-2 type transport system ATP-binding protein